MKIYRSAIDKINGTRLNDDDTLSVELRVKNGDAVRLTMDFRLASELIDCLAAINDEAMANKAPKVFGSKAAAFRNCNSFTAQIDINKTVLLLEFDPHAPHRVGVAIPLAGAPSFVRGVQAKLDELK